MTVVSHAITVAWRVVVCTAIVLRFYLPADLHGQTASDFRVVRRGDRHGLIVMLPTTYSRADSGRQAMQTDWMLFQRGGLVGIPLEGMSTENPAECPTPDSLAPEDRICVALDTTRARQVRAPTTLADTAAYVLLVGPVRVFDKTHKAKIIGDGTALFLEPVAGQVLPSSAPSDSVVVNYDLDLSKEPGVRLSIQVNGQPVLVKQGGYRLGLMRFYYDIARTLRPRDSISASFARVEVRTPIPPGVLHPATVIATDSKDTTVLVELSYTGMQRSKAGTLVAQWKNGRLFPVGHGSDHYEGAVSPYVDALLSTDPGASYINVGFQYSGFVSGWLHRQQQFVVLVTPRGETDKKATVLNLMYLDVELRVGVPILYRGPLPFHGFYDFWPHVGIERGHTATGKSVIRPESNNPSRSKAGLTLVTGWPAVSRLTGFCRRIGCGGVTLSADWQRYWLNRVPLNVPRQRDYVTVTGLYKFTSSVGLSVGYKKGYAPPLFAYSRMLQVGLALVK